MRFYIQPYHDSTPKFDRKLTSRTSRSPRRRNAPRLEPLESRELLAISNLSAVNPITPSPIAGTSFTNALATFTSTDTSFNGVVNWGDGFASVGSAVSIIETNTATNTWTVSASHTYTAATIPGNPYPITISVTDNATPTVPPSVVYTSAIVKDAAITVTPMDITAQTGIGFTNTDVATFTSLNPFAPAKSFSATINWGDGSPNTAGLVVPDGTNPPVFHVEGSHTYTTSTTKFGAPYQITVTIQSTGGSTGTETTPGQATVTNSSLNAQAVPIVATEGTTLSNVVVATFSDTGGFLPNTTYSATINWGDGSPNSVVTPTYVGGSNYQVISNHTYEDGGNFPVSVAITTDGNANAATTGRAVVAFAHPLLSPINISTTEQTQFAGYVAQFTVVPGVFSGPANDYIASIDWGDGTPPTQGQILAVPGGYLVNGIHTYANAQAPFSQNYPVTITIHDLVGNTYTSATGQAVVSAIPIVLTGRLDPATDTGISNTDAITNDTQPRFLGTSKPGSIIYVYATPYPTGGSSFVIGQTEAGPDGTWSVVSTPLVQGQYTITATAIDPVDRQSSTIQILPNATQGPLTIVTQGPKITAFHLDVLTGEFAVTFQGSLAGLDQETLNNGNNYIFTSSFTRDKLGYGGKFIVTGLVTTPPSNPLAPQTVIGFINNGRPLRGGQYKLTVVSGGVSGVQDIAGNGLDGEFYGFFPSGDNRPGGNFVARVNSLHTHVSAPLPDISSASPVRPPGTLGMPYRLKPIFPGDHRFAVKAFGASSSDPLGQNGYFLQTYHGFARVDPKIHPKVDPNVNLKRADLIALVEAKRADHRRV